MLAIILALESNINITYYNVPARFVCILHPKSGGNIHIGGTLLVWIKNAHMWTKETRLWILLIMQYVQTATKTALAVIQREQ
jgi:hypothetical protein